MSNFTLFVKQIHCETPHIISGVSVEDTVLSFKERLQQSLSLPTVTQRLIFKGKVLKNNMKLCEYGIEDNNTLHLVVSENTQANEGNSHSASVEPQTATSGQVPSGFSIGSFRIDADTDISTADVGTV